MEFKKFRDAFSEHFKRMTKGEIPLYVADVNKDALWELYLASFPEGSNPVYRVRSEHDCGCCRHFVKNVGDIVSIRDGIVTSVWDFAAGDPAYQAVVDALAKYVKSKPIVNVFRSAFPKYGTKTTFENKDGVTTKFDHFEIQIPQAYQHQGRETIDSVRGQCRDTKNVFKRSLDEISEDSILTVLELTRQNSLYKGEEWKAALTDFLKYKKFYDRLAGDSARELFAWEKSVNVGGAIGRIRNHSIGVLLVDISSGEDLDTAVRKYEAIVAPANYKRPKAIYTQRMLDDAKKTITDLGYLDSLPRRYAKLDDITVNNILFSNKDSARRIAGASDIFAEMGKETKSNPKKFSKLEELSVDKFVNDVLPDAVELEVYFENKHASNMVSLIAPVNAEAKTMFKWDNGFSWAYSGNMTDSMLKERVKAAGGSVTGDLRFSIQWNDGKEHDGNDLDAHCHEPNGEHIYFGQKRSSTGGELDIDIITPRPGTPAVENITWPTRNRMRTGTYQFFVRNFSHNGGRGGFRAEIEFDGQIYSFDYSNELRQGENVKVAEVTLNADEMFSIVEKLPSSVASRELWGISTNQFVPVSVVMFSPNYWDEQQGIGHRHYLFMLKDCVNPEEPNGFYNEFLKPELEKHRKVFEALGAKAKVAFTEDQLSGLGFSSTKRSELVVKVKGQTERIIKILF